MNRGGSGDIAGDRELYVKVARVLSSTFTREKFGKKAPLHSSVDQPHVTATLSIGQFTTHTCTFPLFL